MKALAYLEERAKQPLPKPGEDIHAGRPPALPLPDVEDDRVLTIEEKAAILAALHDAACPGVEKIDPAPSPEEEVPVDSPARPWAALMAHARELTDKDRQLIEAILPDVRELLEKRLAGKSGSLTAIPPSPQAEPSDRQRDILQGLFECKSFDIDHRRTTEEIATAVEGQGRGSAEDFKAPIADLARRKLVQTKEGRGGGVWLTEEGKKYIKKARKR